jgi:uncharacterized delta-60 repeat protein
LVRAIVVQRDGKILVGGSFSEVNGVTRTNLARLHADGSLDAGFVPASGAADWYQGVVGLAVLGEGKVLVGGRLLGSRKLLCRLNANGSLDASFSTNLTGYELIQFAVRSDGRIYAAGPFDLGEPGWYYSRLVLVNADGTIDGSFAPDFGNSGFYCFTGLAVQPNDHLLVSGWFQSVNGAARNQIARLSPEGRVDDSFDPGTTLSGWSLTTDARSMVLEPDGHIWLGGAVPLANGSRAALVRLQPNGRLDQDFYDEAGEVKVAGDNIRIQALAALEDGRLYVGGSFDAYNNEPRKGLARVLPDGALDRGFRPSWTNGFEVELVKVQPDGKVLAGASSDLVRFNSDGSLDPNFLARLSDDLGLRLRCLALQADGRIVLGGEFAGGLVRLNRDGSTDNTFHPPYLPAYDGDAVYAVAVQPDGKILFGGNGSIGFQRLFPDGSVDPGFSFAGQPGYAIRKILLLADGGMLVMGQPVFSAGEKMFCLARLHGDGSMDESFKAPSDEYMDGFAVAPDGWVLVATRAIYGGQATRIRKLDPHGNPDPAFQTQLGPGYWHLVVADMLVQRDGQVLVVGGFTSVSGTPVDGLARLNNAPAEGAAFVTRAIAPEGVIRLFAQPVASCSVYAAEDAPPAGWAVTSISHSGVFDAVTGKVKFGPFFDHEPRTLSYQVKAPVWGLHCAVGVFCFNGQASADGVNSRITGEQCETLAGYFPADLNPADRRISMDEVTAYGAAWRSGAAWLCHEQGIPIDYLTRAAFLWRGGECYEVSSSVTNEPLWWVSCQARVSGLADREDAGKPSCAERTAPSFFVPGEALTVTLSAAHAGPTAAYAIEEYPPRGWLVSDISSGGNLDVKNGKVKWGPFFDNLARTLTYRVTAPRAARGTTSFMGVGSFDGVSVPILGRLELGEGCRLAVRGHRNTDEFRLTFSGREGARFILETSNDLGTWTRWTEVSDAVGEVRITNRAQADGAGRFFRARVTE